MRAACWGAEHPDTLQVLNNLANTLGNEKRYPEAEKLQRQTLESRRRTLGPDHPDALYSINNLADVVLAEGRYDEAERLYREALERERRVLGENHSDIGILWYNLACVEEKKGHRSQAIAYLRQALDHGYTDVDFMVADDTWNSLHGDPQYQAVLSEIRQRAAAGKEKH